MRGLAESLQLISVMALPFLLAVTWREAARGFVAHKLGDPTPRMNDRLKLNPLAHVDPVNTVVVPLVAFMVGVPFLIGSGKIMPINLHIFSGDTRKLIKLGVTGIVTNFLIAVFFAYVMRFALAAGFTTDDWIAVTGLYGIMLNSVFMIIHLLPIPPLDGGQIVAALLPEEQAAAFRSAEPYGFFILLGIFFLAPAVILVPMQFVMAMIISLVGVPLS